MRILKNAVVTILILSFSRQITAVETAVGGEKLNSTAVVVQSYGMGGYWRHDRAGVDYGTFLNLSFKQKLFEKFHAEAMFRVQKPAGSDREGATLSLEQAQFTYLGPFFNYTLGRRDIRAFLIPGTYFGPFLTMGESRVDAVSLTIPFRVWGDIPDSEAFFESPYNAMSLVWIPNLFSVSRSSFDGSQGLFMGQLHVKFAVHDTLSDLTINYARGTDVWFENSPLSELGGFDFSYKLNWPKEVNTYMTLGIQSAGKEGTSALVFGEQVEKLQGWTFATAEVLTFEMQLPLGPNPGNPFTGGNARNPDQAEYPEMSWFMSVVNRLGSGKSTEAARFHYGLAVTNNPGDYTFARLKEGALSVPVAPSFGQGSRIWDMTFTARDYQTVAVMGFVGYEF